MEGDTVVRELWDQGRVTDGLCVWKATKATSTACTYLHSHLYVWRSTPVGFDDISSLTICGETSSFEFQIERIKLNNKKIFPSIRWNLNKKLSKLYLYFIMQDIWILLSFTKFQLGENKLIQFWLFL